MVARHITYAFSVLTLGAVTSNLWAQAPAVPAAPVPQALPVPAGGAPAPAAVLPPQQGDPQVLDEGPIHEAFADPAGLEAKPRVVVNREPTEPINELPPEVKPDGNNLAWIPGYWMSSEEQGDGVRVSGM